MVMLKVNRSKCNGAWWARSFIKNKWSSKVQGDEIAVLVECKTSAISPPFGISPFSVFFFKSSHSFPSPLKSRRLSKLSLVKLPSPLVD